MSRKIKIKHLFISFKIFSLHILYIIHLLNMMKTPLLLFPLRLIEIMRKFLFLFYPKIFFKIKSSPHVLLLHINFKIVLKLQVLLLKMLLLSKILMSLLMDLNMLLTLKMLISLSNIHLHLLSLYLVLIHQS